MCDHIYLCTCTDVSVWSVSPVWVNTYVYVLVCTPMFTCTVKHVYVFVSASVFTSTDNMDTYVCVLYVDIRTYVYVCMSPMFPVSHDHFYSFRSQMYVHTYVRTYMHMYVLSHNIPIYVSYNMQVFADFQKHYLEESQVVFGSFVGNGSFGDIFQGTVLPFTGASVSNVPLLLYWCYCSGATVLVLL